MIPVSREKHTTLPEQMQCHMTSLDPLPPPPSHLPPPNFPLSTASPFFFYFFRVHAAQNSIFIPPLPAHLIPPPHIFHLNFPFHPPSHHLTPGPAPCLPHLYQEIYRPFTPTVLNLCLHFLLFLNFGVGQVVETLHGKPVP